MTALATRIEITKLAAGIGVDESGLAALDGLSAEQIRAFREVATAALFGRHEARLKRIAALSNKLPPPVVAKISQNALGPMLAGRITSVMDARDAAKLAEHVDHDFMAKLAVALDPRAVTALAGVLGDDLIVELGRRLLDAGEIITLARFTAAVSPAVATAVVADASGDQLLQIALYLEEQDALDRLVAEIDEPQRAGLIEAAKAEPEAYDLITSRLGPDARALFA